MSPERRICKRRILYSPEYLDMGAENGGVVLNLSEGGLGFQTVEPVEPGSEIRLSFSLGPSYRVEVKARVAWVGPQGKSGGAAFGRLSKDSHSLIREWLAKPEFEQEESVTAPVADSAMTLDAMPTLAGPSPVAAFPSREAAATPAARSNDAPASEATAPTRNGMPAPAAPRAQTIPAVTPMRPQAVAPLSTKVSEGKREGQRGDSFSVVPSLSAWSTNDAPARPTIPQPKGNGPLFPLRNAENIFARSGARMEREPDRRRGSTALLVISVVIAAGAILAFYVRAHRQELGEAIVRVGNAVAGTPAATGAAMAAAATVPTNVSAGDPAANNGATAPTTTPLPAAAQAPQVPAAPGQVTKSAPAPAASAGTRSETARSSSGANSPFALKDAKTASANAQPPANPYGGQAEYQRAENYLDGNGVTQDYAEAADWFWRSLEAGDTNAAIPLANLYLEGNGVSRSCTQARILLDAAAQKNIAEAIQKLAQLPENCQ